MKIITIITLILAFTINAATYERQSAEAVILFATNLLADDPDSQLGKSLLQFTKKLDPENDQYLLLSGLLDRNLKPEKVKALPEDRIVNGLVKRALFLLSRGYNHDPVAQSLGCLYVATAIDIQPSLPLLAESRNLLVLYSRALTAHDLNHDYNELLKVVTKTKLASPKPAASRIQSLDERLATAIASYGINQLGIDGSNGNALIAVASKIDPEAAPVLYHRILKAMNIETPAITPVNKSRLLDGLISQSKKLFSKGDKRSNLLAALYAEAAILIDPTNRDAIILVTKAKARGLKVVEIGQSDLALASQPKPRKSKITGTTAFNGHSYKVFVEPVTWPEAKAKCEAMGGSLISINNDAEFEFSIKLSNDATYYWLGAEKLGDHWHWLDGSRIEKFRWAKHRPNTKAADHTNLTTMSGRKWKDSPPYSKHKGFICEWPYVLD